MRNEIIFNDYSENTQTFMITKGNSKKVQLPVQTTEFSTKDAQIETLLKNSQKESQEVQVDYKTFRDSTEQIPYKQLNEEELKRLGKFLKKLEPVVIKEIEESLTQKAYQNYEPESTSVKQQTRVIYTLENHTKETSGGLEISDLCWNATGMIVAASFSAYNHQGSCNHKGLVCTWSIFKRQFKTNTPQILETNGCINCISFHPMKPSLLACGSYSGEIFLYDLAREDENLIAKSNIDDYYHREIISRIIWWEYKIPGSYDTVYNILSLATDGKILLWDMRYNEKHKKQLLQNPIKGFLLLRKKEGSILAVGGLSMQMSKENKNIFIIGSEGGSILRANLTNIMLDKKSKALLDSQTTIKFPTPMYPFLLNIVPKNLPEIKFHVEQYCTNNKISEASLQILFQSKPDPRKLYSNPITFAYEPSSSPVTSIYYNKYGLFVVNGCQGSSKIYEEGFKQSLETIDGGYQIRWINGSKLAGFFEDEWIAFDWITGNILSRISALGGISWNICGELVIIGFQKSKVKVVQLGNYITDEVADQQQLVREKINQLKGE